jgi:hypothetical protein
MSGGKSKSEWVPWYRARSYKGNLSEAEKRQLDAFRMQPRHPAAMFDDLPEEVQNYVNRIELELYDKKQEGAARRAIVLSAVGAVLLFLNYKGCSVAPDTWSNIGGVLLLLTPWPVYWYQWRKNAEEFLPTDTPGRTTGESIRQERELNYLAHSRKSRSVKDGTKKGRNRDINSSVYPQWNASSASRWPRVGVCCLGSVEATMNLADRGSSPTRAREPPTRRLRWDNGVRGFHHAPDQNRRA